MYALRPCSGAAEAGTMNCYTLRRCTKCAKFVVKIKDHFRDGGGGRLGESSSLPRSINVLQLPQNRNMHNNHLYGLSFLAKSIISFKDTSHRFDDLEKSLFQVVPSLPLSTKYIEYNTKTYTRDPYSRGGAKRKKKKIE